MTVSVDQVQNGIISYIEREIAPQASSVKKFGIYFAMPLIRNKIPHYLATARSIAPELFDDAGNIDIDKTYNMAKDAIRRSGQVVFMGIIFNETDVDKLYAHMRPASY